MAADPALFDEALETLRALGLEGGGEPGPRVMRFELIFLRELGYGPALQTCAACAGAIGERNLGFSAAAGGVVCNRCLPLQRERRPLSARGLAFLRVLAAPDDGWRRVVDRTVRGEVRQVLGHYITYLGGKRPRFKTHGERIAYLTNLEGEMKQAAAELDFERAARLRDEIRSLRVADLGLATASVER